MGYSPALVVFANSLFVKVWTVSTSAAFILHKKVKKCINQTKLKKSQPSFEMPFFNHILTGIPKT
jgi:hypothetical protein